MQYNVVIIGGSSGFGGEITKLISNDNKFSLFVCGKHSINSNKIKFLKLNLVNFKSIKHCIFELKKKINTIDILILNSSCFFLKKKIIQYKYERSFLLNYFAQFYIINLLKRKIIKSKLKKIIVISSHTIFNSNINYKDIQSLGFYNFWKSYKNAKKLMLLYCLKNFKENKKISYIFFNPGRIKTGLGTNIPILGLIIKFYHLIFGNHPKNVAKDFFYILKKYIQKNGFFYYFNRKKKKTFNMKK